jgi:6-phosphogluconolactonase (cycloisomerase 2 family)
MTISRTLILGATLAAALSATTGATELPAFATSIRAGSIVAISDGDFVGRTYENGQLAPAEAGFADQLSVLSLAGEKASLATLPVSNSVTAAPEVLGLTPDGRTAFVIERLGRRPADGKTVRDLPPGRQLAAIDLSDKTRPRLAATREISAFPEALAVSPDGRSVATVSNTPDASVVELTRYENGSFGAVQRFDLRDLGITGQASGPRGGVAATNVQWHPDGRILAVNINTQNRVAFFAVSDSDGRSGLRPWGEPVGVGPDPFVGRFSPDGRFYLTSNWGRDFAATNLDGRIPRTPSTLSVIRLAGQAEASEPRHLRIADVETDNSAEGLAISPDGTLVATINMRTTAFSPASPRFQRHSSVTLLRFDTDSGALTKIADYPMDGVLPEGGAFDLSGEHFLATVFQGHEGATAETGPGLETFRVVKGAQPRLERLGRIPMPHGVHHVVLAR